MHFQNSDRVWSSTRRSRLTDDIEIVVHCFIDFAVRRSYPEIPDN